MSDYDATLELYNKYPTAPPNILSAIQRYAEDHIPTGGFTRAVLENNLSEAIGRADQDSLWGLQDIVRFVHWEIPGNCHGSPAIVEAWLTSEVSST